jgi:hypothetical protein
MDAERQIIFHENYFINFYLEQKSGVQEKIEYVFKITAPTQKAGFRLRMNIEK